MKVTRRIGLALASLVFLVYVLAPVGWMLSSSVQSEAEITSKPPHWIAHEPTLENFAAIFQEGEKKVTYETRRRGDTATGATMGGGAATAPPGNPTDGRVLRLGSGTMGSSSVTVACPPVGPSSARR